MKKIIKILITVIIFIFLLFVFSGIIMGFEGLLNYGEFGPSGNSTVGQVSVIVSGFLSWIVTKKINRKIFS
tara:strand:+ start:982 stop:1194 length:213 start_codon:yes stop_codon:yes gene_type:complete